MYNWNCVVDVLNLGKDFHFQDTTLVCSNGKISTNSFILASIFPVIRQTILTKNTVDLEEKTTILLPDADFEETLEFLDNILHQKREFFSGNSIKHLVQQLDIEIKFEILQDEEKFVKNNFLNGFQKGIDETNDQKYDFCQETPFVQIKIKKEESESVVFGSDNDLDNNFENFDSPDYGNGDLSSTDETWGKKPTRTKNKKKSLKKLKKVPRYLELKKLKKLTKHLEPDEPTPCPICGKLISPDAESQRKHKKYHRKQREKERAKARSLMVPSGHLKCQKCKENIPEANFNSHTCTIYSCELCGKVVNTQSGLENHKKVFHDKQQLCACEICGKEFNTKFSLDKHIDFEHNRRVISCDICGYRSKSLKGLQSHQLKHADEVECTICFKKMNPYRLKKHMAATHAEKKHNCEECGKAFPSNHKLQGHKMNVHLKLRPYKCRYGCELAYNDSSNRCAHEKRVHGRIFREEN